MRGAARLARRLSQASRIAPLAKCAHRSCRTLPAQTLRGFVASHTQPDAMVYTDGEPAYWGLPHHEAVRHSVGEYVRGMAHTNGMESFWSMLKRAHMGTFHKLSPKHLNRYVLGVCGAAQHRATWAPLLRCGTPSARLVGRNLPLTVRTLPTSGLDSGTRIPTKWNASSESAATALGQRSNLHQAWRKRGCGGDPTRDRLRVD